MKRRQRPRKPAQARPTSDMRSLQDTQSILKNIGRRHEMERLASQVGDEIVSILESSDSAENKISALFELTVPSRGKSETVGGEIVRAVNRIGYRFMNDGDLFYTGYGIETCGSDALYLANETNDSIYKLIVDAGENGNQLARDYASDREIDRYYRTFLSNLEQYVVSYLQENIGLFSEPNNIDSRNNYDTSELEEDSKCMEYEPDIDYILGDLDWDKHEKIERLMDAGEISNRDFQEIIREAMWSDGWFGGEYHPRYSDDFCITHLTPDEYKYWCENFPSHVEYWADEVIEQHSDFFEDDEEEDDEDDEDF